METNNDIPTWARHGLPSPRDLLEDAARENESDEIDLEEYMDVVLMLRQKGLSWRRVAAWFKHRGFDFNHVAIYRAFNDWQELEGAAQQENPSETAGAETGLPDGGEEMP